MRDKKILIIGVGNILLADEGFGVHAMRYLEENYSWPENVALLDGATRGLLLMSELLECDLAIFLDIAAAGESPGTFYYLSGEDMNRSLSLGQSMHQTSLSDVLISCDLAGHRPEAWLYCMEPFDFQTPRASLSHMASVRLPEFCRIIVAELAKKGLKIIPKPAANSSDCREEKGIPLQEAEEKIKIIAPEHTGARILVEVQPGGGILSLPRAKTARQLLDALNLMEETALVARNGKLLTPDARIWPNDRIWVRVVASRG